MPAILYGMLFAFSLAHTHTHTLSLSLSPSLFSHLARTEYTTQNAQREKLDSRSSAALGCGPDDPLSERLANQVLFQTS